MIQERFFYLLYQLNKKEFKQFKRYLLTLSEERRIRSIDMSQSIWDFLQKSSITSTKIKSFKEQLFKTYFAPTTYNNLLLNKHLHYLSQQLEEFLILLEIRNNKLKKQEMLLSVAQSRKMTKEYFASLDKTDKLLKAHSNKSFNQLYHQFNLTYQNYFHPEVEKARKYHKGKALQQILEDTNHQLDLFYWTAKYRVACEMTIRRETIQGLTDNEQKLPFTKTEAPVLHMYQAIFRLLQSNNADLYLSTKQLVLAHIDKVNNEEQNSIIGLLYNFQGIQLGHTKEPHEVYKEMIEIARIGFEQNIFGKKYPLDENIFIGFYQIARIVYPEWAELLLEKYIKMLSPIHQKNTYNLCKAFYAFEYNDFEQSLILLQQIEYNNFNYLVRARALLVMCYYELRESHKLDVINEANNFARHLKTNKTINKITKTMFTNFTKMTRRLIGKHTDVTQLEKDILEMRILASKKWLLEKVTLLKE